MEEGAEAGRAPDVAAEGGLAGLGGVEGVDGGEDEAEVAGDEVDGGVAEGLDDEGHDLGVGGGGVGGGEDLEAGLEVFAGAVGAPLLPAPDRAAVGVAGGVGAARSMWRRTMGTVKSGRSIISAPSSRVTKARARMSSP